MPLTIIVEMSGKVPSKDEWQAFLNAIYTRAPLKIPGEYIVDRVTKTEGGMIRLELSGWQSTS